MAEILIASHVVGLRSDVEHDSAFSIADLRPNLVTLMGSGGLKALISHALTSATTETPWLSELQSKGDGTFDGLESARSKLNAAEFHEGRVVFVTHLLQLLVQFLGSGVTRAIVSKTWPHAPLGDANLGKGWSNDKGD